MCFELMNSLTGVSRLHHHLFQADGQFRCVAVFIVLVIARSEHIDYIYTIGSFHSSRSLPHPRPFGYTPKFLQIRQLSSLPSVSTSPEEVGVSSGIVFCSSRGVQPPQRLVRPPE